MNIMQAQRRTGGTGLGLYSLSKRLESLGGSCGVKDRADGASGSCFWVSIPYKPDDSVTGGNSMETVTSKSSSNSSDNRLGGSGVSKESDESAVGLSRMMMGMLSQADDDVVDYDVSSRTAMPRLKILLVDDSIMIRKTTSRALIKEGHQVEVAQHGAECLKVLEASKQGATDPRRFDFDLILMDLQMPVMDGLEATKRIRTLEQAMESDDAAGNSAGSRSRIMIVGISAAANAMGEAYDECIASGMDGFIEKPLRIKAFQEYYSKLRA